jgi:hypothetical protein
MSGTRINPANQSIAAYFPQVVDGGDYVTAFTIMNPTATVATGVLSLKDGDGNPWSITLADGRTSSQFSISIPALGSSRLVSIGKGPMKSGWAVLDSQALLSSVETFEYHSGSTLLDSVGVVGVEKGTAFAFPIDTSSTADTGFAVVNVGTSGAEIKVSLRAEDGSIYLSASDSRLTLAAQKYLCLFASQLFPSLQSKPFKGTMVIEAVGSGRIAATSLAYKEGQLSSIPVAAVSPSVLSGLTSQEKARRLLGSWVFSYAPSMNRVTSARYSFTEIKQDTNIPTQWYALGTFIDNGAQALGGWSVPLQKYVVIHDMPEGGIVRHVSYGFDFTGTDIVSGYASIFDGMYVHGPYPMTGTKTSSGN